VDAVGTIAAVAAVAVVTAVVLRELVAYDRPATPPEQAVTPVTPPAPEPVAAPEPEHTVWVEQVAAPAVVVPEPVLAPHHAHADEPAVMFGGLATHEADDGDRRVGAAVVLLALTLLTAGLVGAGIYRALTAFR
jgi:hypothetical protein